VDEQRFVCIGKAVDTRVGPFGTWRTRVARTHFAVMRLPVSRRDFRFETFHPKRAGSIVMPRSRRAMATIELIDVRLSREGAMVNSAFGRQPRPALRSKREVETRPRENDQMAALA
jgi:hypothetical protein